jgi:putative membrane protein
MRTMSREALTLLTAGLIGASGLSLLVGWWMIRVRRDVARHRAAMLTAASLAALFLVAYVVRWALHGSARFAGTGGWKTFYLGNLLLHVVLAMVLVPLVVRLLHLALVRRDFVRHRRLARWTLPIWLYVAASGWLIYWLLYRFPLS